MLQDGSYEFNGRRYQLPLNEPEHRNAIHGLVRWSTWTATEREPHRVVMDHILYPQPGYPFLFGFAFDTRCWIAGFRFGPRPRTPAPQSVPTVAAPHPFRPFGPEPFA